MKEQLYALLKDMLMKRDDVLAAYVGGSKATGFDDEFSDLDLEVICKDDAVEDVFSAVEHLFKSSFGILRSYRMPEPAWHGFSQCFYLVDHMPKHFYVDLAVIKQSIEDKLSDSKRHGHPDVWFDKGHYIMRKDDDEKTTLERCKQRFMQATSLDFLMMIEVEKNLDRMRYLESYTAYYRFIINQLGVMLNLKHRLEKVDFGIRYAYRDYSKEDYELLKILLQNQTLDDIKTHYDIAKSYYLSLKESLKKDFE